MSALHDIAERPSNDLASLGDGFFCAVIRCLPDPVFVLDEDGRYVAVLGGEERSHYDSAGFLVGKTLYDVLPRERAEAFHAEIRQVLASGRMHVHEYPLSAAEVEGNPNDGPQGVQWFQGRIACIDAPTPSGKACVAWVIVNISERKRLEDRLKQIAHSDGLTGVLTRRAFLDVTGAHMAQARATPRPGLQFAMLDLDHFKAVNDRFGHLVGDALLQHVAGIMQDEIGRCSVIGRLGGEEFGVLLQYGDLGDAVAQLSTLQQVLRMRPLVIAGESIEARFSAGVVSIDDEDRTLSDLMRRADRLLYQAKAAGRDRVAYPGWIDRRHR